MWKFRTKSSDEILDSVCNNLYTVKSSFFRSLHTESELFVCILIYFVFVILSYQNACYECENAKNRTWSQKMYDGRKFRTQCVIVIDTTWGRSYFLTCEKFGRKFLTQFNFYSIKSAFLRSLHTESKMFVCVIFIFVILSYQNACYGCENAENRTWSEFFYDGRKFCRKCVNVIDTTWGHTYIWMCENFGLRMQKLKISSYH